MRVAAIALGLFGIVACSPTPEPRAEESTWRLAVDVRPLTLEDPRDAPEDAGPQHVAAVRILRTSSEGSDEKEVTRTAFVFRAGEEHGAALGGPKPGQDRAPGGDATVFPPPGWEGALLRLNAGGMATSGSVLVFAEVWEDGAQVWQDEAEVWVTEPTDVGPSSPES